LRLELGGVLLYELVDAMCGEDSVDARCGRIERGFGPYG
jgi:hypothetical protein